MTESGGRRSIGNRTQAKSNVYLFFGKVVYKIDFLKSFKDDDFRRKVNFEKKKLNAIQTTNSNTSTLKIVLNL